MADYSQADRPFRVEIPQLEAETLLLEGFSGEEGISVPFCFTLDILSPNPEIDPLPLLRQPAVVTIQLATGDERVIHGLTRRFVQLGQSGGEELTSYRAELVPWFWFLSLSSNCQIFPDKTVLDIVEEVFHAQGYSDFEIRCANEYPTREYCVQYRETHLDFVSRLLEEEGIFYFFQHSNDKHTLILGDDTSVVKPCPGQSTVRMSTMPEATQEEDFVTAIQREYAASVGKVTLKDYDYSLPSLDLESSVGDGVEEVYDYPGKFTKPDEGVRLARLRLEREEATQDIVRGVSTCRAFQSGFAFELNEHYRKDINQTYQLLRVRHAARAGGFRAGETASFEYSSEFEAIPHNVLFRPTLAAKKPKVQGSPNRGPGRGADGSPFHASTTR
jgi:type VI secretion system secreted protein VgrG